MARGFVAGGANVLINITNDFWFGDTAAPIQHADMAVLRAVENGVPLVRCANTGISMIVDPWGRVSHRTATFVSAMIDTRVTPSRTTTYYVRHGEWLLRGILGVAGAWIVCATIAARTRT
jgi:apolipoprotein N-acyltransferase